MTHLMEECHDLMPLKDGRSAPNSRPRKLAKQYNDWQLKRALLSRELPPVSRLKNPRHLHEGLVILVGKREVALDVVIVHPPRTPHGIVRRTAGLPSAREKVRIDPAEYPSVFIHHFQLPNIAVPYFTRSDIR